jgi:hypothetical protein
MTKLRHLLVILAVPLLSAHEADANAWYPPDCGVIDHCATVDEVFLKLTGEATARLMIFSTHRSAVVQKPFFVGASKDQALHVCMLYDPFGDLEVTCLLVPDRPF